MQPNTPLARSPSAFTLFSHRRKRGPALTSRHEQFQGDGEQREDQQGGQAAPHDLIDFYRRWAEFRPTVVQLGGAFRSLRPGTTNDPLADLAGRPHQRTRPAAMKRERKSIPAFSRLPSATSLGDRRCSIAASVLRSNGQIDPTHTYLTRQNSTSGYRYS